MGDLPLGYTRNARRTLNKPLLNSRTERAFACYQEWRMTRSYVLLCELTPQSSLSRTRLALNKRRQQAIPIMQLLRKIQLFWLNAKHVNSLSWYSPTADGLDPGLHKIKNPTELCFKSKQGPCMRFASSSDRQRIHSSQWLHVCLAQNFPRFTLISSDIMPCLGLIHDHCMR